MLLPLVAMRCYMGDTSVMFAMVYIDACHVCLLLFPLCSLFALVVLCCCCVTCCYFALFYV